MKPSRLKRPHHAMPADLKQALTKRKLMAAYAQRPHYQQNDCISWITERNGKKPAPSASSKSLDELASGDRYMKMPYRAKV